MTAVNVGEELLSVADVAAILGCPTARVRWYRAEGELPAFYVGTRAVFRRQDVDRLRVTVCRGQPPVAVRPAFRLGDRRQRILHPLLEDTAILGEC